MTIRINVEEFLADLMDKRQVFGIGVVLFVLLGLSVYRTQKELEQEGKEIVLYDQLSTVQSSVGFREGLDGLAAEHNFEINYRNATEVTVSLLKRTPKTRLLVLRMHSGGFDDSVWLFSGETYSESKYVLEQVRGQIHIARCSSTSEIVFAVGEDFINENWSGLDDTLVVLMGCSSLGDTGLAEKMIDSGAVGVIGWDEMVSIEQSDSRVLRLIRNLIDGGYVGETVEMINKLGEEGNMVYYPETLSRFKLVKP